jgi:Tol biopolymer transport system component
MQRLVSQVVVLGLLLVSSVTWQSPPLRAAPTQITTAEGTRPSWSPDGSQIAFTSRRSGRFDIWVTCVGGPSATEGSTWGRIKGMFR